MSNLCKYCGGTQHTIYEGESDPYTIDDHHWKCGVCGKINVRGDYEEVSKKRYRLITEYPKDEFFDNKQVVKFDSYEVIRTLNQQADKIADLEAKLAESEKEVKHWHDLYNNRDKQFQSVRQRYHLLNKLQSNYDKKDKLHLAYMQCAELVDENEKLRQQLADAEEHIDNLEVQLREQYQLVDEKDEKLAEKEKKIEKLKLMLNKILTEIHKNCYSGLNIVKFKEMAINDLGGIIIKDNQDKISFAVERLVGVQKYISDNAVYIEEESFGREINDYIDNQIAELKKGVE